jgi:hypothetical protein
MSVKVFWIGVKHSEHGSYIWGMLRMPRTVGNGYPNYITFWGKTNGKFRTKVYLSRSLFEAASMCNSKEHDGYTEFTKPINELSERIDKMVAWYFLENL